MTTGSWQRAWADCTWTAGWFFSQSERRPVDRGAENSNESVAMARLAAMMDDVRVSALPLDDAAKALAEVWDQVVAEEKAPDKFQKRRRSMQGRGKG